MFFRNSEISFDRLEISQIGVRSSRHNLQIEPLVGPELGIDQTTPVLGHGLPQLLPSIRFVLDKVLSSPSDKLSVAYLDELWLFGPIKMYVTWYESLAFHLAIR